MPHQPDRPWYVDMVKEISGLGLVLIMLVGLYFLADEFAMNMQNTWNDIKEINEVKLKEDRDANTKLKSTITTFLSEQSARLTEQSERMRDIEKRLVKLEVK